jgi:hypothetical protein
VSQTKNPQHPYDIRERTEKPPKKTFAATDCLPTRIELKDVFAALMSVMWML